MRYLVAYDIACPRRLRRVARLMERHAMRCQKSVFLMETTVAGVHAMLDEVRPLIELNDDLVQAWRLAPEQPDEGVGWGQHASLFPQGVVCAAEKNLVVTSKNRAKRRKEQP